MKRLWLLLVLIFVVCPTTCVKAELVDNGDGTVTDTDTNLMWVADAGLFGTMNWYDASALVDGLDFAGHTDWRLPSGPDVAVPEMSQLNAAYGISRATPGPFIGIGGASYWTSRTFTSPSGTFANTFNFVTETENYSFTDSYLGGVLPVREADVDEDGDGYSKLVDCDDKDASINPGAVEIPNNYIDEDCDGDLGACWPCLSWKNHGQYVKCTVHAVHDLVEGGLITDDEGHVIIGSAAQSDIGKKGYISPQCQ
jgi:hypothetical protein